MKTTLPKIAPAVVQDEAQQIRELFERNVVPSYGRFDLVLERGDGSYVWDVDGRRYLDFGAGIAVCGLGHAHPEITGVLHEQSSKLVHVSNLYYNELQGRLAERLVNLIGPGRCFFCNSGAEANEGLFKLARKFGHDQGRYEVITTIESFHGRTLAGISATGQEKVKKGFEPMVDGFKQVPFNDLEAMRCALTPQSAAILIEPIQGESGVTIATAEYLIGLRQLCDDHNLLLLFDEVQAGHFRTGKFHSWQTIVDAASSRVPEVKRQDASSTYLPDGISMAKALGNGFPMGAFWVRDKFADLLGPGSHATTFGGTPLACAVALKVLEVMERDQLPENALCIGSFLKRELQDLQQRYPTLIRAVRGFGLMLGIEFVPDFPAFRADGRTAAIQVVNRLHEKNLLTVPAGTAIVRLLPPLNLSRSEAEEGLTAITAVVEELNG
ncbi:MAG: acetylornithine/N-succinyldiaminopimelate aminotransferase [Verrucomicrobiota bacterium]|jgi:acetylornithine aminotransferase/acetylornithine/N-succinyldiaminopimelate aminotransferase